MSTCLTEGPWLRVSLLSIHQQCNFQKVTGQPWTDELRNILNTNLLLTVYQLIQWIRKKQKYMCIYYKIDSLDNAYAVPGLID